LENVAVRYRVPQESIPSLKEYAIRRLQRRVRFQEMWALRAVNIQVERGEVLGIIGHNGAGKSTLLKVVARVLRPTQGRVQVRGRVAPLLELGAGFDQELTGRENIFLNGTMLGFSRRQIAARLQAIVEFAGLEKFVDAPLRTYSSGMIARLGFSVATDALPDILIVDEILSVGDAEFQRKSAERIEGFRQAGATILVVSHSLATVEAMCTRAIWIEQGQIKAEGAAEAVVRQYQSHTLAVEGERLAGAGGALVGRRLGNRAIEIVHVCLMDGRGEEQTIFETGQPLLLRMDYEAHGSVRSPVFGMAIHRHDGAHVTGPNTALAGLKLPTLTGRGTVTFSVPYLPLLEGLYHLTVAVVNRDDTELYDYHDRAYPFRVVNLSGEVQERYGLMTLRGEWKHSANVCETS
jgi:lipopolysaccharide transport system ATP-binding protein